jgi:hypothetical protein
MKPSAAVRAAAKVTREEVAMAKVKVMEQDKKVHKTDQTDMMTHVTHMR